MASNDGQQKNIAVNPARSMVFFEGDNFCYNYKTNQWTSVPAYNGLAMYSINAENAVIGLTRFSGNAVDLQTQLLTAAAQTAILATAEADHNPGGRSTIKGVRPLINGGTVTVRVGSRNDLETTVSYSTATSLTSRTGFADFRQDGRYHRTEITIADGFTTALGQDLDVEPSGSV